MGGSLLPTSEAIFRGLSVDAKQDFDLVTELQCLVYDQVVANVRINVKAMMKMAIKEWSL